jgi:hypothetical protein
METGSPPPPDNPNDPGQGPQSPQPGPQSPPPGPQSPPPPPGGPPQAPPPPGVAPAGVARPNAPGAVPALVLGLIGLFCTIAGPFAWWQGKVGEDAIERSPGQYEGKGLATAGKILGIIETILLIVSVVVAIVAIIIGVASN